MTNRQREIVESPLKRGVKEEYPYKFTLTGKVPSGTYSNAGAELYEDDKTTAVSDWSAGSASVSSTEYVTPDFVADVLEVGKQYHLSMWFDIDSDRWDWYARVKVQA